MRGPTEVVTPLAVLLVVFTKSGDTGQRVTESMTEKLAAMPLATSGMAPSGVNGKAVTPRRGEALGAIAAATGTTDSAGDDAPAGTRR